VAQLCTGPWREELVPGHPYLKGELLWALRQEMALRGADFLVRRIPLGLLDQEAARSAAPFVLETMARELSWDPERLEQERQELDLRLQGAL
jgi:glycerol-3-phosphate dehydrogenase